MRPPLPHSLLGFLLLCFPALPPLAFGQDFHPANRFSLDEALDYAMAHSPLIRNQDLQVQATKLRERGAFSVEGTEVFWQRGNINSGLVDNAWQITQDLGQPLALVPNWKLLGRATDQASAERSLTKAQLSWQIKLAYYRWIWLDEKRKIFEDLLALDLDYLKQESERFAEGKVNEVEQAMARTDAADIQQQLQLNLIDLSIAEIELQQLLTYAQPVVPKAEEPKKLLLDAAMPSMDVLIKQHPEVKLAEAQEQLSEQALKAAKAALSPSAYAGWFWQEIDHERGFNGWYAGVSIPLVFIPQQAEIQASKLDWEMARNDLALTKINIATNASILIKEFEKASARLAFYEQEALPQADLIVKNSKRLVDEEQIDYIEYLNSMSRALSVKLDYLDALYEYNSAIINLEFLFSE